MIITKLRISAVSYTNTKPFLFGLNHFAVLSDQLDISLDIPTECAQKLIDNRADVGLIPVAALLHLPYYEIVSDYCIGADGVVNSVFIFSDLPIDQIKSIRLDPESRSSNNLARVLMKEHWQINPLILESGEADAMVLIGDRTFGRKREFKYVYDLATEWKSMTGLPFAFAVWVANKPIEPNLKAALNEALAYGVNHRIELLKEMPKRSDFDLDDYLLYKIDFIFDEPKRRAMDLYLNYLSQLTANSGHLIVKNL